jgi:hypothetical protein
MVGRVGWAMTLENPLLLLLLLNEDEDADELAWLLESFSLSPSKLNLRGATRGRVAGL